MTLLTVLTCSILLTSDVGKYFIFNFHNNVLFWVLLLPYLTFLTLVTENGKDSYRMELKNNSEEWKIVRDAEGKELSKMAD